MPLITYDVQVRDNVALDNELDVGHEELGAAGCQNRVQELGLAGGKEVALLQGLEVQESEDLTSVGVEGVGGSLCIVTDLVNMARWGYQGQKINVSLT